MESCKILNSLDNSTTDFALTEISDLEKGCVISTLDYSVHSILKRLVIELVDLTPKIIPEINDFDFNFANQDVKEYQKILKRS